MRADSRKQVFVLSFTLVVVLLGFGMVIPIVPFYIEKLGDSGGEMGTLVAREYGRPCVSGLEHATETLLDGQTVEMDGASGVVRLV